MDLSKLSNEDLVALRSGDISKLSNEGLMALRGGSVPAQPGKPMSTIDKVLKGVRDPIDAGAQLLTNGLSSVAPGFVEAGNKLNNWLADKTGLVGRLPEGGVDQQAREAEQTYQAKRAAAGESGFDGYRAIGNVISPANLAVGYAGGAMPAASLLQRVGQGAATGAAMGGMTPVGQGDFASEKAKQIGVGALGGALLPAATGAVARVIRPNTSKEVQTLLQEGVTPTAGQILGGRLQVMEDKATSLPIVGDAISSARGKSLDEFNRAAYARALAPVNGQVPKEVGRDGVQAVRQQIGQAYDDLLPKMTFKPDAQFQQELGQLQGMAQNLAPTEAKKFNAIISEHLSKASPNGGMTGETFKVMESALNNDIKRFSGSSDAYQQELGDALKETLRVFRSGMERSNPQVQGELQKANAAYANYARIRDAASRQGSLEGKFTPAQLAAAIRSGDKTVGKRAYSEGDALMQDLSDAGKKVLASQYPNSGTAGRLALGLSAGGVGAMIDPATLAAAGAASAAYLPGGRQLMSALLAKRPEAAAQIAEMVRKSAPYLAPAVVQTPQLSQ